MHELTQDCLIGYMLWKGREGAGSSQGSPQFEEGGILRRLLLLVGITVLGALLFASVALAQTTPPFVQEAETAVMVANGQITAEEACARGAHCYVYVQSYSYDLPPFVEPHPPPRLHSGRLDRRVGILQPEPECVVVRVAEVGVGLPLEGGNLGRDFGQVLGYVLDGVGVVLGPRVWVLAHPLRIRQGRQIP